MADSVSLNMDPGISYHQETDMICSGHAARSEEMSRDRLELDCIGYNALTSCCATSWTQAFHALEQMATAKLKALMFHAHHAYGQSKSLRAELFEQQVCCKDMGPQNCGLTSREPSHFDLG